MGVGKPRKEKVSEFGQAYRDRTFISLSRVQTERLRKGKAVRLMKGGKWYELSGEKPVVYAKDGKALTKTELKKMIRLM